MGKVMKKLVLPKSLSEFVFLGKWAKYLLAAALVIGAIALWVASTKKVPENWLWLSWLTAVSVVFVAVVPLTNKEFTRLHITAAILACVMVTVLTVAVCPWAISVWAGYVSYTLLTDCKYKKLAAELCCVVEALAIIIF